MSFFSTFKLHYLEKFPVEDQLYSMEVLIPGGFEGFLQVSPGFVKVARVGQSTPTLHPVLHPLAWHLILDTV